MIVFRCAVVVFAMFISVGGYAKSKPEMDGGTLGKSLKSSKKPKPKIDEEALGKSLYVGRGSCLVCHGAEGKAPTSPNYPKLTGQSSEYIKAQLLAIKNKTRNVEGLSSLMFPFMGSLSVKDIQAISDYLSKVK